MVQTKSDNKYALGKRAKVSLHSRCIAVAMVNLNTLHKTYGSMGRSNVISGHKVKNKGQISNNVNLQN